MPELNLRKVKTSLRYSYFGFYDFLYHSQSCRIYDLVSIGKLLYGHTTDELGKKPLLIFTNRSMIGDQSSDTSNSELERLKCFSYASSFK